MAPLNILDSAPPIGPVLTPSQYTELSGRLVDYINRQAYAGGHYTALEYSDEAPNTNLTRSGVLSGPVDVQDLAGDGWDLTGKGGFYRINIFAGFYWPSAVPGTMNTAISYVLREVGGANLLANTFPSPGAGFGAYYAWEREHYVQIPDDIGPVEWVLSVNTSAGTAPAIVNPSFEFDFERIAGWPVA